MTAKIKTAIITCGFIIAAVLAAIIVYANYQRVCYQQALGASAVLTAEYEAYKQSADGLIAGLNTSINDLIKQREAAVATANAAQSNAAALAEEVKRLQGETAGLPPDGLVRHIEPYIGAGNISLTGSGLFSLTRPGAENSLNLFIAGEGVAKQYADERAVSKNLRVALDASMDETMGERQKFALKDGELTRAIKAWESDKDALKHLQRSILGRRVKSFVTGAVLGSFAVFIYNAIKEP